MVKFLNSDGLSRLVTLIKQALSNKQDSRLVVTYVGNNDASSTYGDILNAINAGKEVIVKYGYKDYQYCYNDSGWLYFIAVVAGYYYELRVNDEDKWNSDSFQLQSSLVSGTNIKTVNGNTLLGSGNVSLKANNILMSDDDPNGDWVGGDTVEEALVSKSNAINALQPNEIASISTTESSVSGGNNSVTITETNGTSHTFNVKNGIDGQDGADGADGADGVSLGEIALVQTTGNSEESVMSQKAVTEYARKVTDEDLNGTSTWIRSKLEESGWEFGKRISNTGAIVQGDYCVSPKIPVNSVQDHILCLWFGQKLNGCYFCAYDSNDTLKAAYNLNYFNIYRVTANTSNWSTATYVRLTLNPNKITECYIYDETADEFIFRGNDYINNIISDRLTDVQILEQVRRNVSVGDLSCSNIYVRNLLTDLGWRFSAYNTNAGTITSAGTEAKSNIYVTSPLIPCRGLYNHTLDVCYNFPADSSIYATTHSENGTRIGYLNLNANNSRLWQIMSSSEIVHADDRYIRLTINASEFANCYIYDRTTGEYIFKGDDYLAEHLDGLVDYHYLQENIITQSSGVSTSKLMSQKAITDELNKAANIPKANYLQGKLALFELADYPQLDPRTADGISIVFTTNKNLSGRCPIFAIWNPFIGTNSGFANPNFSLTSWDGNLKWGRVTNYFAVQTGGYSISPKGARHHVVTYDFKTGMAKYYKNGVLSYTSTLPSGYNEQDLRDYFDTCTHILVRANSKSAGYKTNGIAIFGSVLSDNDVVAIYGSGNACIRNHLIPIENKAKMLHPLVKTDWTVYVQEGVFTALEGGGYTVTKQSGKTLIRFGFTGLSEVINNCIYEWDFEITSGTLGASSITYNRVMQYEGYYRVFTITDANGNDVTLQTLGVGTYHVVAKPDNVSAGAVNASSQKLVYRFDEASDDFSMTIKPTLKVTERGAGLECSLDTYRGSFWEQECGIRLPMHPPTFIYPADEPFYAEYDTYLEDIVIYNSSTPPQFNGQMAVDTTNNKVYVGYLTGTGGTWKQINNS